MLKGTTKIELTDVNTGETQVIEKHNAITGALQELFNPVLGHLTDESKLSATLPAYASLLGGLLLFDERIDGNPLPVFAPETVKLVGCARYNAANTTGSIYMGSYDANESIMSAQTKTAKFVYNFTQSQANGTINSVCLTHRTGGLGVYGGDVSIKSTSTKLANSIYATTTKLVRGGNDRISNVYQYNTDEHLFAVDADNDIVYYFKVPAVNTIVTVKRRLGLRQYSIFGSSQSLIEESAPITLPTGIHHSNNNNTYCFDAESNALYIISSIPGASTGTTSVNAQFTVTRIVLGENTATQFTLTNTHTTSINIPTSYVYRGRLYTVAQSTAESINGKTARKFPIVSFDLATGARTVHGIVTSSTSSSAEPMPIFAADGRIYWQGYYDTTQGIGGLQVLDCTATPGEDIKFCGVDTVEHYTSSSVYYPPSFTPIINHPMLCYLSAGSGASLEGFYYLGHYLATVNNLSTPIVKAPTQTMKITYTIQEV